MYDVVRVVRAPVLEGFLAVLIDAGRAPGNVSPPVLRAVAWVLADPPAFTMGRLERTRPVSRRTKCRGFKRVCFSSGYL